MFALDTDWLNYLGLEVLQQMSNYTEIIKKLLDEQYKDRQTQTIVISTLNIKFIPFKAQELIECYSKVTCLTITNCDLRKLEHFPILPRLAYLDISSNSLQGTFNYLMPLKSLTYLNIARNIISDYRVLQPLRRLGKLEVYLKDNPFTELPNWKGKLRLFNITVLKQAKTIGNAESADDKEEEADESAQREQERQQERKKQTIRERERERRTFNFGSYREKLMTNLQNSLNNQIFDAQPLPEMDIPHHFDVYEHPLSINNMANLAENIQFDDVGSELNIDIVGQDQLQLADDYASENFDEGEEEGEQDGQEDEEPDAPYF